MTIKESMMSVYRNQMPDQPVVSIYTRYLSRGEMERKARNSGLGIIAYIPLTSQIGPPWHMLDGFLSEVRDAYLSVRYMYRNGALHEQRTYHTPAGDLTAEIGKSAGKGSEHIAKYYIRQPQDYRIMDYIVRNTALTPNTDLFRRTVHELGEDGVVMGRMDRTPYQKLLIELAGAERFLMDLFMDSEPVEELLETMGKRYREQVDMAMDSEADIIWIPDNVTVDMTPPENYEKYLMPHYRYCVQCAKEAGKLVVVHCDGKIRPLCHYMNEIGFDAIESVSDPMISGDMTFSEAVQAFPGLVILPNFPSNLSLSPKETIWDYIEKLKAQACGVPLMLQISEDLEDNAYERVIPIILEAMYERKES